MQDKYPNIDKQITDRGWAAMEELLDRELPTDVPKKKRRRWMLFLLFFGIGFGMAVGVVAGGLYFLNVESEEVQSAVNQAAEEEVAPIILTEKGQETPIGQSEMKENEAANLELINDENDSGKQNLNKAKGTQSKEEATNEKVQKQDRKPKNENIDFVQYKNDSPKVDEQTKQAVEMNNTAEILAENNSENPSIKTVDLKGINLLDTKEISLFDLTVAIPSLDLGMPELPEEKTKETKSEKGRLGVEILGQGASNMAGLGGGAIYSKPINDKFFVQTGLNYTYQKRIFTGIPFDLSMVSNGIEINYPGLNENEVIAGTYDDNNPQSVERSVFTIPQDLSLHYLNLPVKLGYQFHEKWSVGAGVSGGLLLYASNTYTNGGLFNSSFKSSFLADDTTISSGSEQEIIGKANLQNYDIATNMSVAFHPSPKWSMVAQYHHGFVNLFKYSSDKKYNRYAQLSLQYHFGK